LKQVTPYLIFKRKQAQLFLQVIQKKAKMKTVNDFIALAKMIDNLEQLNYSKKRRITSKVISESLKKF
ncbi:MAG: hypothetical protein GYA31_02025, partial [Parcubacteria group bacterium]|nr:hypothetical protein [Parcubacteria group bacterium]